MTGFGRGVARAGDLQVTVEVRAVNHRFLDVKVRGTPAPALEELAVARIRERLERGAVTVAIAVDRGGPMAGGVDRVAARRVYTELAELARELALPPPHLAEVLRVPGVETVTITEGADPTNWTFKDVQCVADAIAMKTQESHVGAGLTQR